MEEMIKKWLRDRHLISQIVTILLLALFSFIIYKFLNDPVFYEKIRKDGKIIYLTLLLGVLGVITSVMAKFLSDNKINGEKSILQDKIDKLKKQIQILTEPHLTKDFELDRIDVIADTLLPLEINIETYIRKLGKNSIVNLIIGVLGTIISISVLFISLLSNNRFETLELFMLNFIPKVSFVVFIQIFAFFFLRLYKGNLEDSKYFQNELTNIVAKSTAIQLASHLGDNELSARLVEDLSRTERNFRLAPGESLMNIEKAKLENEYNADIINALRDIIKSAKKN